MNACTIPSFWRFPSRADGRAVEHDAEAFAELVAKPLVDGAPEARERLELVAPGQPVRGAEVSRQVADQPPRRDSLRTRVQAVDRGSSRRRVDEPEEQADRGGLPGTVRAEVAEDLAPLHAEDEVDERAYLAVVRLGEPERLDRRLPPPCGDRTHARPASLPPSQGPPVPSPHGRRHADQPPRLPAPAGRAPRRRRRRRGLEGDRLDERRRRGVVGAGPAAVALGAVTCVLAPEQTEGPYYLEDHRVRRNITEGEDGSPR